MANPKRRHSNSRTRKRRTHQKLASTVLTVCKECGVPIHPHQICPKCGFYKGKRVLTIKVKEKKKDDKK